MPLKSPRFANDPRLQRAAENNPPMGWGESGEPVRKVQQALIDLGFPLPLSTRRTGSPDGVFGKETYNAVLAFQRRERFSADGVVGKDTLGRMDTLLPNAGPPLPPPEKLVPYLVPGTKSRIKQPTGMSCWATCWAMIYGWKRQVSVSPRDAVVPLGERWVKLYDSDKGLPIHENVPFAIATRLTPEPLMSLTLEGWALLLRDHGLLWFVFGWEVAGLNGKPNRKGRHALVLEGIVGDGTNEGSKVRYTDPADGKLYEIAFLTFIADYELGFTLGGGVPDSKIGGFSQILHF